MNGGRAGCNSPRVRGIRPDMTALMFVLVPLVVMVLALGMERVEAMLGTPARRTGEPAGPVGGAAAEMTT